MAGLPPPPPPTPAPPPPPGAPPHSLRQRRPELCRPRTGAAARTPPTAALPRCHTAFGKCLRALVPRSPPLPHPRTPALAPAPAPASASAPAPAPAPAFLRSSSPPPAPVGTTPPHHTRSRPVITQTCHQARARDSTPGCALSSGCGMPAGRRAGCRSGRGTREPAAAPAQRGWPLRAGCSPGRA